MTERLLGVDIGTTGVRAALFEPNGALVADASVASGHHAKRPGWAETSASTWWTATTRALRELGTRASLTDVAAIGVVGQAPTAVLVDGGGELVRDAILWLDTRADDEARALAHGVHAYHLGPKLLWIAKNEPALLERTRFVLQSHAYVAFRFTGEAATDPSTAALCAPLFDLARRTWSTEGCARVGVRLEQLPPIRPADAVLGEVTDAVARETGLRAGTKVVVGGGDFAAATLGAGAIDPGEACLMLGTAGNLLVPRETPGADARLINAHHVGVERWLSLGGTMSGAAQEWLRRALSPSAADPSTLADFAVLDAEASAVGPNDEGLLFLPYLQGERTPIWDVRARGAFIGLGLGHGRGHMWRALLEGIALSFVDCQAVLEEGGTRLREVVAANGGGKSALFRTILCDALGVPLAYAPGAGGTVAGAAILAGLGSNVLPNASAARAWRGELVLHEPRTAMTSLYRERLGLRRRAYEGLRDVFPALAVSSAK